MDAKIKLTRYTSTDEALPLPMKQSWPIRIEAVGVNMPSEIFVYHAGTALDSIPGDRFECVASMNQLEEIPLNAPVVAPDGSNVPYYRSSVLEFICRNAEEADRIWVEVVREAQWLAKNFTSALRLKAISQTTISETRTDSVFIEMTPPIVIQLAYQPAGTPALIDGIQSITDADPSIRGWLPASSAPSDWIKPPGAAFFYNVGEDPTLSASWPPKDPLSGNQLHRQGMRLPYDKVWTLTKDTIWWLSYPPDTFTEMYGTAPWPEDYISPESPGLISPVILLTLYHE